MEITELLELAKNRANLPSDYALAKALGIPNGNLSNIRNGRAHPSNAVAVQLATLAGLDEMRVIAEIELRTANSEKKKEFWKHYIESRGLAASLALSALAISIALAPINSDASILHIGNYDAENSTGQTTPASFVEYTLCAEAKNRWLILKALFQFVFSSLTQYNAAPKSTAPTSA